MAANLYEAVSWICQNIYKSFFCFLRRLALKSSNGKDMFRKQACQYTGGTQMHWAQDKEQLQKANFPAAK